MPVKLVVDTIRNAVGNPLTEANVSFYNARKDIARYKAERHAEYEADRVQIHAGWSGHRKAERSEAIDTEKARLSAAPLNKYINNVHWTKKRPRDIKK